MKKKISPLFRPAWIFSTCLSLLASNAFAVSSNQLKKAQPSSAVQVADQLPDNLDDAVSRIEEAFSSIFSKFQMKTSATQINYFGTVAQDTTLKVIRVQRLQDSKYYAYEVEVDNQTKYIVEGAFERFDSEGKPALDPSKTTSIHTLDEVALLEQPVVEVELPGDENSAWFQAYNADSLAFEEMYKKLKLLSPISTGPGLSSPMGLKMSAPALFAGNCSNFIQSDLTYGAWGTFIMKNLTAASYPKLFSNTIYDLHQDSNGVLKRSANIKNLCPRFDKMTETEKQQYYVVVLASMAHKESSCNPKITAVGVYDTAVGLFQLPLTAKHLAAQGCSTINPANPFDNMKCSFGILNRDVQNNSALFFERPNQRGYWQVLKTDKNGDGVRLRIKDYTACFK